MAQDFHAAFNLGDDDKYIATVDADGVALAAIQGLNQKLEETVRQQADRLERLETELAELKNLIRNNAGVGGPTARTEGTR
jgi:transposase